MWATTTCKPTIDKKNAKTTLPLEKYLSIKRNEFAQHRAEIPRLKEKLVALEAEAVACTERYQLRQRRELQREADALRVEIETRAGRSREHEYEQMIAPYMQAYNQRVEMDQVKETRNIAAPGSGHKRETIDSYIQQHDATQMRQNALISEYLMETSSEPPKLSLRTRDDCPLCAKELVLVNSKSIMICPGCGYSVAYLDATMSSMSYADDVEFSSFSYKRINHFNEWLQQVQAKENFEISDETMQRVIKELHNQRISNANITAKKVREVLKTLKLRKAYEHVAQITCKLTGAKPLRVPPEIEEQCRLMFIAVQPAFERHCPKDRKNFLSYSYCLYKFFELLGYEQFLDSFSLLKGRDKLARQDEIFRKICEDLDWEFVPSV